MQLEPVNSTLLGSIRISLTSAGDALKRRDEMKELIRTDFPDPVVPATKTWGIFAIFATTGAPLTSSPSETVSLDLLLVITSDESIVLSVTTSRLLFGISIPTKLLPGIGASILICPVGASVAKAKSLESDVIFETLVPNAISMAYWVTAGPRFTSTTFAPIPKLCRVFSITDATFFISPLSALCVDVSERRLSGGYSHTPLAASGLLTSLSESASESFLLI